MTGTTRRVVRALVYGLIGATIVLLVVVVQYLENRPDLKVWHSAKLDAEFRVKSGITDFTEYLALEEHLFAELDAEVYKKLAPGDRHQINRFTRGSLADPDRWPVNWNRTFVFPSPDARVGVLLLHGLSDSPYSMRGLGQRLHKEGAWVIGLRVPGHGTAPVGLVDIEWEDMAAAVKLAVQHLRELVGDRPLYVVGYSNGGALAVQYALDALADEGLPPLRGLVLLSPEIGISKLAALAVWQERLGHLFGLKKLAWNSILPEYDPYKYGSFALNAGKQAHELTLEIQAQISRESAAGRLDRLPPILAFQSVVDATVTAPALVSNLFDRLPSQENELVLFDINRYSVIEPILASDPSEWVATLIADRETSFGVTFITNEAKTSQKVVSRRRAPGGPQITSCALDFRWPADVYSLSHVALPFPPDDPLYGSVATAAPTRLRLGTVALRGERGVLRVSAADLLRLRWNPFYAYQERRILEFLDLAEPTAGKCGAKP